MEELREVREKKHVWRFSFLKEWSINNKVNSWAGIALVTGENNLCAVPPTESSQLSVCNKWTRMDKEQNKMKRKLETSLYPLVKLVQET